MSTQLGGIAFDAGDDVIAETSTVDTTTSAVHLAPQPAELHLPARDRRTWMLFDDWCAAHDESSLPASPELLARFLSAHPAGTATQRRRISVINAAHHRHGFPPPGRSDSIRAALDATHRARRGDLAARAGEVITRLPETGWPAAFFARRDAMILTLAATGLTYTQIAGLRICDVTADPVADALHIGTTDGTRAVTPPGLSVTGASPARVHRRWMEVLGFSDRYFSTHMLAGLMDTGGGDELTGHDSRIVPADRRPLLTPIDRWGHTPLTATPLTARAVAGIVAAHLTGQAPPHIRPPLRNTDETDSITTEAMDVEPLGDDYYEHGIAARKHAHHALGDVTSVLDEIEDRADRLLVDLLALLDQDP
ncbi:MAG: recombinase [Rhodococcus sp. (in: high G+C Gram-positive bacteria)]|uniref:recombinase n=1 Tax=Rhodococcus sp. TaxID=1831 RepID=UPI002AD72B8A|nr:recombinase [Rhodococcus sp. (in: high G+C Gram-positive bacteria)]